MKHLKSFLIATILTFSFLITSDVKAYFTYNNTTYNEEKIEQIFNSAFPNDNINNYYVTCAYSNTNNVQNFICYFDDGPHSFTYTSTYDNNQTYTITPTLTGKEIIYRVANNSIFRSTSGNSFNNIQVYDHNLFTNYNTTIDDVPIESNLDFNPIPYTFNFHLNGGHFYNEYIPIQQQNNFGVTFFERENDFSITLYKNEFINFFTQGKFNKSAMILDGLYYDKNFTQEVNILTDDFSSFSNTEQVLVTSKNLFNKNGTFITGGSTTYSVSGNQITVSGLWNAGQKIQVEPNTDYYVSFNISTTYGSVGIYTSDLRSAIRTYTTSNFTFNSGNNNEIALMINTSGNGSNSRTVKINNLQMELGTSFTSYESYFEPYYDTVASDEPIEIDLYAKWRYESINDFLNDRNFIEYTYDSNHDYAIINRGNNSDNVYISLPFSSFELEVYEYDENEQIVKNGSSVCLTPILDNNGYYIYDLNTLTTNNQEILILPKEYFDNLSPGNYSFYLTDNAYISYTNDLGEAEIIDSNGEVITINLQYSYDLSQQYKYLYSNEKDTYTQIKIFLDNIKKYTTAIKGMFEYLFISLNSTIRSLIIFIVVLVLLSTILRVIRRG